MRYAWIFLLTIGVVSCQAPASPKVNYRTIEGKTMGTYYRVTCDCGPDRDWQASLDSLFVSINAEVSTYIPEALISRFNSSENGLAIPEDAGHFRENFLLAKTIYDATEGNFDPTVMPLVNYWGFGYTEKKPVTAIDSSRIAGIMDWVGFSKVIQFDDPLLGLEKTARGVQLDFSACAKGYAVDLAGALLASGGSSHYFVDIGGEVTAHGLSPRGDAWNVGIQTPREGADMGEIQAIVPLDNRAVATSGNYRNYYEVDGKKYSHTINPFTGFPERSTLLSVSVFHTSCAVADAYATAFMVMGEEKAFRLAAQNPDLEAYFIVAGEDGSLGEKYTSGLEKFFGEKQ